MELSKVIESIAAASPDAAPLCRSCGACCSFSRDWPRFTLEDDHDLDRIPRAFADHRLGRMQCDGDRCAALVGEVGISARARSTIYGQRFVALVNRAMKPVSWRGIDLACDDADSLMTAVAPLSPQSYTDDPSTRSKALQTILG